MDLKHHNNFMTPNDNLMFPESVIFRKPKNDTPTKQQTALQPLTQQKNRISKNKLHQQPIFFKLTQRTQHTHHYITNKKTKIDTTQPKNTPQNTTNQPNRQNRHNKPQKHAPRKQAKTLKKTRRNIRVLPSKPSPNPLGLTFWTRDRHDGCIFTRKNRAQIQNSE